MHAATGITRAAFDDLAIDELDAAIEAVRLRDRAVRIRHADLLATLCNLLGGGKSRFSTKDFLSESDQLEPGEVPISDEEKRAGLERYHAKMKAAEEAYSKTQAERGEHAGAGVDDVAGG